MAGKELEIAFIIICLLPIILCICVEHVQLYSCKKSGSKAKKRLRGSAGGYKTLFKDSGRNFFP